MIIPTTDGPARVLGITALHRLPLSRVVTEDDFVPDPAMTERYQALTDPGGPLRGLTGDISAQFELCLDRLPEMGRSWELPVAIAHWAIAQGHELVTTGAQIVVWATGVVRPDRGILPEEYYLDEKLESTRAALEAADGASRILFLPHADDLFVAKTLAKFGTARVFAIDSVESALRTLAAEMSTGANDPALLPTETAEVVVRTGRPGLARKVAAGVGVAAVVGLGAVLGIPNSGEKPPDAPVSIIGNGPPSGVAVKGGDQDVSPVPEAGGGEGVPLSVPPPTLPATTSVPAGPVPEDPDLAVQPETEVSRTADEPPAVVVSDGTLVLVEHRVPPGHVCGEVAFDISLAERITRNAVDTVFPPSDPNGLCAISFEWADAPSGTRLDPSPGFLKHVMAQDVPNVIRLAPPVGAEFVFRSGTLPPLDYQIVVSPGDGSAPITYTHSLHQP